MDKKVNNDKKDTVVAWSTFFSRLRELENQHAVLYSSSQRRPMDASSPTKSSIILERAAICVSPVLSAALTANSASRKAVLHPTLPRLCIIVLDMLLVSRSSPAKGLCSNSFLTDCSSKSGDTTGKRKRKRRDECAYRDENMLIVTRFSVKSKDFTYQQSHQKGH